MSHKGTHYGTVTEGCEEAAPCPNREIELTVLIALILENNSTNQGCGVDEF